MRDISGPRQRMLQGTVCDTDTGKNVTGSRSSVLFPAPFSGGQDLRILDDCHMEAYINLGGPILGSFYEESYHVGL